MRRFTFHLIPHTHWDREWYLTRAEFQARLIPVLDQVLAQLEGSSSARFVLDGQTVLLEDYLAIRPEAEARIAAQVRRGALEIGPWYVLSDLLIPGAASLRRNLQEGIRDAARFGGHLKVLYSPDAFGHPADLPALAAEFGLRWAVVRRGLGRPGGVDRDLYRWDSAPGPALLTYHLPASGYDAGMALARRGALLSKVWPPLRRELVARAVTEQIAVFLGADHHPMVEDVAGLCTRLQELEPDHEVRLSGLGEFFHAVERSASLELPGLTGELRRGDGHGWLLQGVHSARSRMKHAHGTAELMLSRITDPLVQLVRQARGTDHSALLGAAWRVLLQSQFHDTLAGTTSDAVQREQSVRLATVTALSRELVRGVLSEWTGHDPDRSRELPATVAPRLVLWNPASRARAGIMTAELTAFRRDVLIGAPTRGRKARAASPSRAFTLQGPEGTAIPVQVLASRADHERLDAARHYPDQDEVERIWIAFRAPKLTGLARMALAVERGAAAAAPEGLEATRSSLANRFVAIRIGATGALELTDLRSGERYAGLGALEDEPDRGDLYTFSGGGGPRRLKLVPAGQRRLAAGPFVGAVETRWRMAGAGGVALTARQVVLLHADSPLTRIRLEIHNGASDHRLRARYPVAVAGSVLAGAPLGWLRREPAMPARRPRGLEQIEPTAPAQRYVAAAQAGRGIAILAPGFFEYEWTSRGDVLVTLLRAIGELSRGDLPERPGHAAWPLTTPDAEEQGIHRIELALAPLREEDLASPSRIERLWEAAFLPVQAFWFRDFSGR